MVIKEAKFITSAATKAQFIVGDKPIIAVCGKSNVGKSSFINLLANRKKLAKVSKDPGRTRLINYFDFGGFILADLPGYGFAKVGKDEKARWAKLMEDFFDGSHAVAHVFALVDIRHEPTADDVNMINFLYYRTLPFTVIATKADKLSKSACALSARKIAAALKCGPQDVLITSSLKRTGLEEVFSKLDFICGTGEYADSQG